MIADGFRDPYATAPFTREGLAAMSGTSVVPNPARILATLEHLFERIEALEAQQ